LLVRVAVAAFLVASEVLSTFPRPTSDLVIPVGVVIDGLVRVLLVRVCEAVRVTRVSAPEGIVTVPPLVRLAMVIPVAVLVLPRVLLVRVWVAASDTSTWDAAVDGAV
jgi:hypothetical protein